MYSFHDSGSWVPLLWYWVTGTTFYDLGSLVPLLSPWISSTNFINEAGFWVHILWGWVSVNIFISLGTNFTRLGLMCQFYKARVSVAIFIRLNLRDQFLLDWVLRIIFIISDGFWAWVHSGVLLSIQMFKCNVHVMVRACIFSKNGIGIKCICS